MYPCPPKAQTATEKDIMLGWNWTIVCSSVTIFAHTPHGARTTEHHLCRDCHFLLHLPEPHRASSYPPKPEIMFNVHPEALKGFQKTRGCHKKLPHPSEGMREVSGWIDGGRGSTGPTTQALKAQCPGVFSTLLPPGLSLFVPAKYKRAPFWKKCFIAQLTGQWLMCTHLYVLIAQAPHIAPWRPLNFLFLAGHAVAYTFLQRK